MQTPRVRPNFIGPEAASFFDFDPVPIPQPAATQKRMRSEEFADPQHKTMFQAILDSIKAGKSWHPKTIAIPGVVVTKDNVDKFLADHPNGL